MRRFGGCGGGGDCGDESALVPRPHPELRCGGDDGDDCDCCANADCLLDER